MPVIFVTDYERTVQVRAYLARKLTLAAAILTGASAEKIQIFFRDVAPGTSLIEVNAVAYGDGPDAQQWTAAIRQAVGHPYDVRIHLYPPDHTAKAGALRHDRESRSVRATPTPEPTEESH